MTAEGTEINGDRATMRVNMTYSFEGIDAEYVKTSRMNAVKTPEGWRVAARPARPRARTRRGSTGATRRAPASTSSRWRPANLKVGSLMTDLEKGRARMKRGLPGVKAPAKLLVIVARNSKDTKALTKDYRTLSSLVAVAEAQVAIDGPAKKVSAVCGQRVFVLWRSYGKRSADERRIVVAHELVHAALVKRSGGRVPAWLSEGIAMYASGDKRAGDAGALLSGGAAAGHVQAGRGGERALADQAREADVAGPHGRRSRWRSRTRTRRRPRSRSPRSTAPKALLRLYSAFNSEKIKGPPGRKLSDKVVRKTLKTSLKSLEDDIDAYARARSELARSAQREPAAHDRR